MLKRFSPLAFVVVTFLAGCAPVHLTDAHIYKKDMADFDNMRRTGFHTLPSSGQIDESVVNKITFMFNHDCAATANFFSDPAYVPITFYLESGLGPIVTRDDDGSFTTEYLKQWDNLSGANRDRLLIPFSNSLVGSDIPTEVIKQLKPFVFAHMKDAKLASDEKLVLANFLYLSSLTKEEIEAIKSGKSAGEKYLATFIDQNSDHFSPSGGSAGKKG